MAAFLLVPLSVVAGVVAGSWAARKAVREEMDELRSMIRGGAVPEPAAAPPPPSAAVPAPAPAPVDEEAITPEILMVLTAAVAAFLGKKARIRGARVVPGMGASAWAQQGRVYVQASHNLAVHHR